MGEKRWIPVVAAVLVLCLVATCAVGLYAGSKYVSATVLTPSVIAGTGENDGLTTLEPPRTPSPPLETPTRVLGADQELNVLGGDPPTLDPHLSGDSTSAEYIVEIFSGLMSLDRDMNLVPDLAEDWTVSEDGTVYTFFLRPNATFHDGRSVLAEDFVWSFERACDPRTGSYTADTYLGDVVGCRDKLTGLADHVEGVRAVDDTTLKLTIDEPKVYFLSKLSFPVSFVLDKENVDCGGYRWTDAPNGTGPFELAEFRSDEEIVLERNDGYYREPKPKLKRINFLLAAGSPMAMYEQSLLDITPVSLADVDRASDPTNPLSDELRTVDTLGVFYVALNVAQPPFDDVNVRQAFNYALDRQRIVDVVYKKTRPVAWGIIPLAMPNYSNPDLAPLRFDPEKALELIAESKYGDVSEMPDITFHVLGAGGSTGPVIEAIVASYEENLGLAIEVQQTDWATFLRDLNQPDNPNQMWGGEAGWIADYPDPHDFLDVLFRCGSMQNHTYYCNPDVDDLLDRAAVETDPAAREEFYRQVEQIVIDDASWVPLFFDVEQWLVKPYVLDAYLPPLVAPKYQYYEMGR